MKQVPIEDFERRYRLDADPWRFATSDYEQRRFDVTAACLPAGRFRRAFEPGCSSGELTVRLARRCDELVAWDGSPTIVDVARRRVAEVVGAGEAAHVRIEVGVVPTEWPDGSFDLVTLSEIGYYFDPSMLAVLIDRSIACLEPAATLLAVHWLGRSDDHLLTGDEVHEAIAASRRRCHGRHQPMGDERAGGHGHRTRHLRSAARHRRRRRTTRLLPRAHRVLARRHRRQRMLGRRGERHPRHRTALRAR